MSLRCFFGRHRPNLASIVQREKGFMALCDDCDLPIVRSEKTAWTLAEPLASQPKDAA